MANKYIIANWKRINKAIAGDAISELIAERKSINKLIDEKLNARFKEREAQKKARALQLKKELPCGDPVWFIGTSKDISFGESGIKIKDGRTHMIVEFREKRWRCPYDSIQAYYPTPDQQTSHKVQTRITNLFNKLP